MNDFKTRFLSVFVFGCLLAVFPGSCVQAKGSIIYVKQNATGLKDDTSAIDAGNDAACPPHDQSGIVRLEGSHCDLEAYEVAP